MTPAIFQTVWKYDIVNISGNQIQVGNVVIATILLVLGIKFSQQATKLIIGLFPAKFSENKDGIHTLERIISYIFIAITSLMALQVANIPLSIFAFIGGAIAIGVGLGAQGVISNLINSLIIMIEKPIKIGDIIEIQNIVGRVKAITGRCVILENADQEEVSIPNINFMQNNLSKFNLDSKTVHYQVLINISKKNDKKINHKAIIEKLLTAAGKLEFIAPNTMPEVYLSEIKENSDRFCLRFSSLSSDKVSAIEIRNSLNLLLLKELNYDFYVEYSRNLA